MPKRPPTAGSEPEQSSNEMFYIDPQTGRKADADSHNEILDGISPENDRKLRRATRLRVEAKHALSDDALDKLYGPDTLEP